MSVLGPVCLEGIHLKLTDEEIKHLEESYKPMRIIGHA